MLRGDAKRGALRALAEFGLLEGGSHIVQFIEGGGGLQAQFIQPVLADPHDLIVLHQALYIGQAHLAAVVGGKCPGQVAVFFPLTFDPFGAGVVIVGIFKVFDQVGFVHLHQDGAADAFTQLGQVFGSHGHVVFLVAVVRLNPGPCRFPFDAQQGLHIAGEIVVVDAIAFGETHR